MKALKLTPTWSDVELAWLAGLFEGEGCLSQQLSTKHKYWVLAITMTDKDVVRKAYSIAGTGSYIGPMCPPSLSRFKPTFRWVVNAQPHIYDLTLAMLPHLGERRAARILQFHADYLARLKPDGKCRKGLHVMEPGRSRCRLCTNIYQKEYRKTRT